MTKYLPTLTTLIIASVFCSSIYAQKPVDRFISKYLKEDNTLAVTIPGFFFNKTLKFASKMEDGEDLKEYAKLAKHVKSIRVFVMQENNQIPRKEIAKLRIDMRDSGFEEYITVRSKETNMDMYAIENDEAIKQLVFFINDHDDTILLRLKMDMPYSAFKELNYRLAKDIN